MKQQWSKKKTTFCVSVVKFDFENNYDGQAQSIDSELIDLVK